MNCTYDTVCRELPHCVDDAHLPCILPLIHVMFVVHVSDGGQEGQEVSAHSEVLSCVRLVEEVEEDEGDGLAQFGVLAGEQSPCEGTHCTTPHSSGNIAGH